MTQKTVAIVGYGAVGRSIGRLFPDAVAYDGPLNIGSRDAVNASQFAFVAVPTPARFDGSCDCSTVDEVVGWIESEIIIIRSTVAVGTTERLRRETGKRIIRENRDVLDRRGLEEVKAGLVVGEVGVAPRLECQQHGVEVDALVGQAIFVARRCPGSW